MGRAFHSSTQHGSETDLTIICELCAWSVVLKIDVPPTIAKVQEDIE